MRPLFTILIALVVLFAQLAEKGKREKKKRRAEQQAAVSPSPPARMRDEPRSTGSSSAQKRAQAAQTEMWREAKRQQDEAEQVHAVHLDTCDSRLESLRVLYDAGVLDREEYAERVARVKTKHL